LGAKINKYILNQKNNKIKLINKKNIVYMNNNIKKILNKVNPKDNGKITFQPKYIN
jgi:hypothetical protein